MDNAIVSLSHLGFPWQTEDPFLFCAYHNDNYPQGNAALGPDAALLKGRHIGMDFDDKNGWRMYHGDVVPGFPQHPHRGFETVTLVRRGRIDHSDSLGATARFGDGDVQWMTAGKGIVHAEMFPLLRDNDDNPLELFQIWLNLPQRRKMVDPYFTMMWDEGVARHVFTDERGKETLVRSVCGPIDGKTSAPPPPDSWAADPEAHVAIWTLRIEAGATFTLPTAPADVKRTLYFYDGSGLRIAPSPRTEALDVNVAIGVRPDIPVTLIADDVCELLMLQGKPIGEPVVQHGPFVMNTRQEVQQAFADYQRTQFGGWPWPTSGPVHARSQGRFAIHPDGRRDEPKNA